MLTNSSGIGKVALKSGDISVSSLYCTHYQKTGFRDEGGFCCSQGWEMKRLLHLFRYIFKILLFRYISFCYVSKILFVIFIVTFLKAPNGLGTGFSVLFHYNSPQIVSFCFSFVKIAQKSFLMLL